MLEAKDSSGNVVLIPICCSSNLDFEPDTKCITMHMAIENGCMFVYMIENQQRLSVHVIHVYTGQQQFTLYSSR